MNLRESILGPANSGKRPRRAAYALPTLFTSGNVFLGFVAIIEAIEGALAAPGSTATAVSHFVVAARLLGVAVFFDGLDGGIARMTNTTSDFGRELDSLADLVTFGIAPAVLAFVWGVLFSSASDGGVDSNLRRAGYLVSFFYLLCGAVRLARFNVQTNPKPKNPGRPDRKYFVGMPIPAGAAIIASIVYVSPSPVTSANISIPWLGLIAIVGLLMVSTWRYPSFKQIGFTKPRSPLVVLIIAATIFLIFYWSQPVLLAMASTYVASGIAIRIGGIIRRRRRSQPPTHVPEHQIG